MIAALFVLFAHADPVTWQAPDGSVSGTSDVVTVRDSLASLTLVGAVLGLALAGSGQARSATTRR